MANDHRDADHKKQRTQLQRAYPALEGATRLHHPVITFSLCHRYRYTLWRQWDERPPAVFVILNPSTADETMNDPTVERCQRRAQAMGYGGVRVANIFALRSTDPAALYTTEDPVAPRMIRRC